MNGGQRTLRRRPALARALTQALAPASAVPTLLLSTVLAYAVPSLLMADQPATGDLPATHVLWKAAYSERYPGCVSAVLWPEREEPVALVVLAADGRVDRVPGARVRPADAVELGGSKPIGACRAVDR